MRHLTSIVILFAAGRSAAQPAVSSSAPVPPGPCQVTIVRAPEDVRLEIESWVAREPACRVALGVRAIPTEGGLYLLARDSTGRLHERLVPDAQAAGVLVASWIADDTLEPTPLPPSPRLGPPQSSVPTAVRPTAAEKPPSSTMVRTRAEQSRRDGLPSEASDTRFRGILEVGGRVGGTGWPSLVRRQ